MSFDYTTTIPELETLETLGDTDELVIVDKDDLSATPNGTDKKILPQTLVEQTNVRPSTNLTVTKKLTEWVGQFSQSIETVEGKVVDATTTKKGISRLASPAEVKDLTSNSAVVTPAGLSSLEATEESSGLVKLMPSDDLSSNKDDDRLALTAATLFQGMFADSIFGEDSFVFKLPVNDITNNTITSLTIQYGVREVTSVPTTNRPESNFNHSHPFVDVGITFTQPFENKCLMVIPMGFNVNNVYEEGTEFVMRELSSDISGAVIRASRIEGENSTGERIGVKFIAIGY